MSAWADTDEMKGRLATRERLLQQALHDVVVRNGLPRDWLSCQALRAMRTGGRMPVMHVQLVVSRGWELLKLRLPELEQSFRNAALSLDRSSAQWISSVAWVFEEPQQGAFPAGWMVCRPPDDPDRPRPN